MKKFELHRPRIQLTTSPALVGLVLGFGAVVFGGCAATSSQAAEPNAAALASPDEAVARFVASTGSDYAGSCENTVSPRDIGKVCSRFVEQQGTTRAYLTGRTFSEFSTWVFVSPTGPTWEVRGSAPLDFNDMSMSIPWPR